MEEYAAFTDLMSVPITVDKVDGTLHIQPQCLLLLLGQIRRVFPWEMVLGASTSRLGPDRLTLSFFNRRNLHGLIQVEGQVTNAQEVMKVIQSMAYFQEMPREQDPVYRRRLLVLANPHTRRAQRVWHYSRHCLAACEIELQWTQHRGHAHELVRQAPLHRFDAVVLVSGSGLVHEAINALCMRNASLPVAVIPCGTRNALAKVLCEAASMPVTANHCAYIAAKGLAKPIDITHLQLDSGRVIYSFLSVTWAYLADVEHERRGCWGLWRWLKIRRYRARITWPGNTVDGQFIYFAACNLPWTSTRTHLAPDSSMNDGFNHLMFVGNATRKQLLGVLLRQRSGRLAQLSQVNSVKSLKWTFHPVARFGTLSIDGEAYRPEGLVAEVLPAHASVLCLPPM